jgi:ketosteroid isomerase-like protein
MSQENVETVRRGYEHWLRTGELLLEDADSDFVWDMSTFDGWPERQTYPGIEGARQFLADWAEAWETWEVEVRDHIDAGEQVVTIVRQHGHAKATGVFVEMDFGQVWTFQNGLRTRMQMYASPEEALEAAGLSK